MLEQFLWVEKYRPKTVDDTILPTELKTIFQQFVNQQNIPNLILSGSAGVGKTTIAKAMLEQLECDYIIINGSMNGNIDTLRNDIQNFASSVSFSGGRKYVILDEADYLNPNSTQPALRNFMEEFSRNCGFILTCNYKNKIIEPLRSRCSVVDFKISKNDRTKLAGEFFKRVQSILEIENIKYDKGAVAEVITRYFPDWRRVLNELQKYSATGGIDTGILADNDVTNFEELLQMIKQKNFTGMRKWVGSNVGNDSADIFRKFYDTCLQYMDAQSASHLVILIAQYQYQGAFVADQEINMMGFFVQVAMECDFK